VDKARSLPLSGAPDSGFTRAGSAFAPKHVTKQENTAGNKHLMGALESYDKNNVL